MVSQKFDDDIYVHICDFPGNIYGVVYYDSFGCYQIGINSKLSHEKQQEIFLHELAHVRNHLPQTYYIIGIDMQRHEIEKEADDLAPELEIFGGVKEG